MTKTTIHVADGGKIECSSSEGSTVLSVRMKGERTDCVIEIALRSVVELRTARTLIESAIAMRIYADDRRPETNG